jgi:hypothetical protein
LSTDGDHAPLSRLGGEIPEGAEMGRLAYGNHGHAMGLSLIGGQVDCLLGGDLAEAKAAIEQSHGRNIAHHAHSSVGC